MARGLDDFVRPVVTSAEEVFQANGILRTRPNTKYILEVPQSLGDEARARPTLARYLSEGEKSGIPTSYLCRQRKFWWVLSPATPAIISTYMARRPPAFALNEDGLAILNVCHGLYPRVPLTQAQLKGLVNYLNALGTQLNGAGRTYQGGLQKFEPREMEAILVPPPDRLEAYADRT